MKNDQHIRKLRQFAKVTGVGLPVFDDLQRKLHEAHSKFCTAFPDDTFEELDHSPYEGDYAINLHAHYFTDQHNTPTWKHIPFREDVDPLHILESLRGTKFIHGPDNDVQYGRKVVTEGQGTM